MLRKGEATTDWFPSGRYASILRFGNTPHPLTHSASHLLYSRLMSVQRLLTLGAYTRSATLNREVARLPDVDVDALARRHSTVSGGGCVLPVVPSTGSSTSASSALPSPAGTGTHTPVGEVEDFVFVDSAEFAELQGPSTPQATPSRRSVNSPPLQEDDGSGAARVAATEGSAVNDGAASRAGAKPRGKPQRRFQDTWALQFALILLAGHCVTEPRVTCFFCYLFPTPGRLKITQYSNPDRNSVFRDHLTNVHKEELSEPEAKPPVRALPVGHLITLSQGYRSREGVSYAGPRITEVWSDKVSQ
eukprot:GHVU01201941.1.p1 GENE.GHVU01201941.1~~GHVU01201941.1.p1  ORF type:complete len:304 (-),score=14.68 GHVU01201941.1:84-995(-)